MAGIKKKASKAPAEARGGAGKRENFLLRLYVAGATPQSTRAIVDVRRLCEEHLAGRVQLEVVDIYQRPAAAREEQIVVVPTLVRHSPKPSRRLVGDLSDPARLLVGLELLRG
jgi:circadian clock protein KaiB